MIINHASAAYLTIVLIYILHRTLKVFIEFVTHTDIQLCNICYNKVFDPNRRASAYQAMSISLRLVGLSANFNGGTSFFQTY